MPSNGHRNSYSIIKGQTLLNDDLLINQLPYGKVLLLFHATIQLYHILIPNARGILEFFIGGSDWDRTSDSRITCHIAFASWSGLCYNHSINGLGSASIVSTHLWLTSTSINLARRCLQLSCLQLNGGVHRIRAVFMYQFLDTASIRKCDALPTELQTHNQIVLLLSKN